MSRRMFSVFVCILLVMLALPIKSVKAQSKPETVKVGIYLVRAGSLDITTGAIDVDFYIDFTCEQLCDKSQDKFEVLNGSVKSSVVLDANDKTNPTYRVSATVFQDVDLRKYPFDSHPVKIVIESSLYDASVVKYVVNQDTSAIDPGVFILGWDLNHTPAAVIVDQYYKPWNQHYTRYVFTTQLSKPALAGWLKGLLPAIIILLGSLFALFITSKNVGNRVAIITSALVASVLYHMNFTSRVPPIGYLTYGDMFMIINYIVLLVSLSMTVWIIRSDSTDMQARIAQVNKIELVAIPALWLVLHILNYLVIMR